MDNELTKIDIEPVVIPATEEKVYDRLWVTQFQVISDYADKTRLYAVLRPATADSEILVKAGTEKFVDISDLFGILTGTKREPKLTPETIALGGQLMGLTLMFLKSYLADKATPEPIPEPTPEPEIIPEPEVITE